MKFPVVFWALVFIFCLETGILRAETPVTTAKAVPAAAAIQSTNVFAGYAGSASCRECHARAYDLWSKSHHAEAERLVETNRDQSAFEPARELKSDTQTTRVQWCDGQAQVVAPGLSHIMETNIVDRVIGEDPLWQFLVPFPGGRWQTLEASYDPHSNAWFNVFGQEDRQPGEWGHWTGRGMNWNSMCAACHNTRLLKNYDAASDAYHTTMAERTVSCEACHGPLKAHVEWQKKYGGTGQKDPVFPKLSRGQIFDMCASCHTRRADLTGNFVPGDKFLDHYEPSTVDASELYYPDGQVHDEDYETSAFLGSKMYHAGLTCLECHPRSLHIARLHGNDLCLQCHKGGYPKAPVINPLEHSHHAAGSVGNECACCHMPVTVYMQRHPRHDHGFTIPDPLLTRQFGIPNACNRCHKDQSADWALTNVDQWYGAKMQRHTRERAQVIARARNGDVTTRTNLIQFLHSEDNGYWRAVAAVLLAPWAGEADVRAALLQGLNDTNAMVRSACVRGLGPLVEDQNVARAVQVKLNDPLRNVRVAAAWALRASVDTNSTAGADLLRMLACNADQPVGQLQLGEFYASRGDLAAAVKHLKSAVNWDEFSTPLRLELAVMLSALGKTSEAVAQLQVACQKAPKDAEAHFSLALAYNELGEKDKTRTELETAVQLNPKFARAWYNLGLLQNSTGETQAALTSLLNAEKADPSDPAIPYARATILARLNRTDEAKDLLRHILRQHPDALAAKQMLDYLSR